MTVRRAKSWLERFFGLTLTRQFLAAGGLLMILAMAAAGFFVFKIAANHTIQIKAASTAIFMESIAATLVQDLAHSAELSPESRRSLDGLFDDYWFSERFPHLEIWTIDGRIAYSRTGELIGQRFEKPDGLNQALLGDVAAGFADLRAREHVARAFSERYLEIYSPLREISSGRIIAVAEIQEETEPLAQSLRILAIQTWGTVGLSTILIMAGLFGVVYTGSKTIERQRTDLNNRMSEAEAMSTQNELLKNRAERASLQIAELNETFLRGLGADLHDGPAQLLGYSLLKFDQIRRLQTASEKDEVLHHVEHMVREATKEIRAISKGMLLPDIERLSLREAIENAVKLHEGRTNTPVAIEWAGPMTEVVTAIKMCAYRFVQEGLANAYRHADGKDQRVRYEVENRHLILTVSDAGQAAFHLDEGGTRPGLGLKGLRLRVESIGGTLTLRSSPNGSQIEMRLDIGRGVALA